MGYTDQEYRGCIIWQAKATEAGPAAALMVHGETHVTAASPMTSNMFGFPPNENVSF